MEGETKRLVEAREASLEADGLMGLPTSLPSEGDALKAVQELLGGTPVVTVLSDADLPLTVRLLREARLKREMHKAEVRKSKERWRQRTSGKKHWKYKKAVKDRSNEKYHRDHYRTSLEHRFSRWKRRGRTKLEGIEMTLEEFSFFWLRIDPKHQLPFYRVSERVTWKRVDTSLPWSIDNLDNSVKIGKGRKARTLLWRTLDLEAARSQNVNSPVPVGDDKEPKDGAP